MDPFVQLHSEKSLLTKLQSSYRYYKYHLLLQYRVGMHGVLDSRTLWWNGFPIFTFFQSLVNLTTCFHEYFEYESTNFFYNINIIFSKGRKNCLFWPIRSFFFKWEILVKKFIHSYFWKFVKTYCELNNSSNAGLSNRFVATGGQRGILDQFGLCHPLSGAYHPIYF